MELPDGHCCGNFRSRTGFAFYRKLSSCGGDAFKHGPEAHAFGTGYCQFIIEALTIVLDQDFYLISLFPDRNFCCRCMGVLHDIT